MFAGPAQRSDATGRRHLCACFQAFLDIGPRVGASSALRISRRAAGPRPGREACAALSVVLPGALNRAQMALPAHGSR